MKRQIYLAVSFVALALVSWQVARIQQIDISIPVVSTASAQIAPNCSIISNNLAVPFGGRSVGNFSESTHTLALVTGWADVPNVVEAIKGTDKTVIIRLGAGKAAPGPEAADYVGILNEIADQVEGKAFIATAGHNEPNCAEFIPLATEVAYVQAVAAGVTASNVTLITGQIDHTCGDASLPSPKSYIDALATIPGIEGLALPFYITEGTPTVDSAVSLFTQVAGSAPTPSIYVTESGPLKEGSMREFVTAVPTVLANTKVKTFLLFNALGLNPDAAFTYTKPFWNPRCREALRTQCQDPEAVMAACGGDLDDYYLYPIAGLATQDRAAIFNDLISQGYEAQCSTPAFYTEAQEGGQISRLKELVSTGQASVQTRELEADLNVSYVSSTVPVWRDSNPVATLMNSLEDYWGFLDLQPGPGGQRSLNTAPIYSLTSVSEQCEAKVKILETIENLCSKLKDPTSCALYQPIPGAGEYDTQTLLPAWRATGLSCKDVELGEYRNQQEPVVSAVLKTPLYLDRAYRLAFVVMATELRDNPSPLSYFNFLRRDGGAGNAIPKHEIKVVAFKFPDIGTNHVLDDTAYQDPLKKTRDALLTVDQIQTNRREAQAERDALRAAPPPEALPVLECGGESCGDPLVSSLVQMINNQQAQCKGEPEDFRYEPSDIIGSSGTIQSGQGTEFADGSDPTKAAPQSTTFNFLARIGLGGQGDSNAQTQVFLIYPMGFELEKVENTLLTFFESKYGEEFLGSTKVKDYFKIGGVAQTMTGGKATADFYDPTQECLVLPESNTIYCSRAEVELKTDLTNREPRVLGGRLGNLTRKIQESLNEVNTAALAYLRSCKTTEEFLLGLCDRKKFPGSNPTNPTGNLTAVAQCQAGGARITSGEDAVHIPSPTKAECNIYDPGAHNIPNWKNPNDPVKPCEELFSYAACTYPNSLIQNPVTPSGEFSSTGTITACQYIVNQAKAAGISPRFALAMWGEESGFSHYRVPDFGVISLPNQQLGAQFNGFKGIVEDFSSVQYQSFLERYSGEERGSGTFCNNRYFPGRLRVYYEYLGP